MSGLIERIHRSGNPNLLCVSNRANLDRRRAQMAKKSSSSGGKARSAITGRYVTKGYAKRNPKITVVERDKPKRSGKRKK